MLEGIAQFSFPTQVRFGVDSIGALPNALAELGAKHPLLVTDPGLVGTDAYEVTMQVLSDAGLGVIVFAEVHSNPLEEDVEKCAEAFRSASCDAAIGLGGGSAMDVAKALAVRVAHEGPLSSFEAQAGGYERIEDSMPPVIAIPTTAGTGSEVGRSAVITVPNLGRKIVIFSPYLMPKRVIMDPKLTVSLPPHLTAATGMDAFTHCIESLTSPEFQPICDAVAVGGLELVIGNIERATKQGDDLEARGAMLIAAMMGGMAFQKDLGAAHSLAHPLSTECGVHHGLANAVCLPAVMRFNCEAALGAYARLAGLFGINTFAMEPVEAAGKAVDAVAELNHKLGLKARLRDCGVKKEILPTLADKAFEDSCHKTNPRPCTRDDLMKLYEESW